MFGIRFLGWKSGEASSRRRSGESRGFTLIELMVVVAIISVLAAIIIPVFSRARESARQTTCKGNLHAIAIAMRNFTNDHADFPMPYDPYSGEGGVTQLYLEGYLQSNKVLSCPDDPTTVNDYNLAHSNLPSWVDWTEAKFKERYSSYNEFFGGTDYAYSLYNYFGYTGYASEPIDPDYPRGNGASRAALIAIADSEGLYLGNRTDCNQATLIWATPVYRDSNHPNYWDADTSGPLLGRVYDRPSPQTDDYARPLFSDSTDTYSSYFPGLINRNAPDYTIITHCPWHREWFGREAEWKDLAVRLSGDVDTVQTNSYDWVVQRPE